MTAWFSRFKKSTRFLAKLLTVCGMVWFLLPFLRGGFSLGAGFGFFVCLFGFLLLQYGVSVTSKGGWRKCLVRALVVFYIFGLFWAGYLTVQMVSVGLQTPPSGQNVIVLGSQVYSAERMGKALTNRIQKAAEYLEHSPDSVCIVTGGQGNDEPCTEALAEKNALLRLGVSEERIYLEDRSHNTRQNFEYAKEIAEQNNLGSEFVIVTQGFHMWRAKQLAESAGFTVFPLVAETDPLLLPEYYGRELLSLTKWHVETYLFQM